LSDITSTVHTVAILVIIDAKTTVHVEIVSMLIIDLNTTVKIPSASLFIVIKLKMNINCTGRHVVPLHSTTNMTLTSLKPF